MASKAHCGSTACATLPNERSGGFSVPPMRTLRAAMYRVRKTALCYAVY